ncbi:MAG TPA: ABC transporter permease [Bacteroidota bacterium]
MFSNYIKIAIRNLLKHKAYSVINIAGLAVGLVCCLLIGLYVQDELSYDRYHEKIARLYKVVTDSRTPEKESRFALTPAPLGETFLRDFPEVESYVRLFTFFGNASVHYGEKSFIENKIYFADSTFFSIFSIPMVAGDPVTALTQPNSIVLSETMARKYFANENPLGKSMRLNTNFNVQISGVMADIPSNTHFHPDFLVSMSSIGMSRSTMFISNMNFHTYLVLREGATAEELEAKLPATLKQYAAPQVAERFGQSFEDRTAAGFSMAWSLLPMSNVHLYSQREYEIEANGNITTVYIFSIIALVVLLIACVNFMNLSTARAASRAKEIGVRKVVGSNRTQLLAQFFIESTVMSMLALFIALAAVELVIPEFNALAGKQIKTNFFGNGMWLFGFFGIALVVGALAGTYPAVFLSSLRPVFVLKGGLSSGKRASSIRSGLVVFQFAVSIALITGTLVVRNQLGFISGQKLGFKKEQVLVIKHASSLGQQREVFKQELLKSPTIMSASASTTVPGKLFGRSTYKDARAPSEASHVMHEMEVDAEFVPALGMKLVAGRNFSSSIASDSAAVIVNQAAASLFGWADPIGQKLAYPGPQAGWRGTVVGVVEDFHFESLHTQIQPLVILHQPGFAYISVRIQPEHTANSIQFIETTWKRFAPQQPFEFSFLDQDFETLYRAEQQTGMVFTAFATLAIFIACLGQLGLAAFVFEKRTKEIGIRKVLGASVTGVVGLLSKDFLKLVLIANLIAWPVAYTIMSQWLESFAYRIEIGWWIFALAGGLAILIAFLTVSFQAIRAATANPVEALKYE